MHCCQNFNKFLSDNFSIFCFGIYVTSLSQKLPVWDCKTGCYFQISNIVFRKIKTTWPLKLGLTNWSTLTYKFVYLLVHRRDVYSWHIKASTVQPWSFTQLLDNLHHDSLKHKIIDTCECYYIIYVLAYIKITFALILNYDYLLKALEIYTLKIWNPITNTNFWQITRFPNWLHTVN